MKYRKKPIIVEAMQLTKEVFEGEHPNPLHIFATPKILYDPRNRCVWIDTLEGRMRGDIGDWIVKGVKEEFYPVKPEIFAATYEPVSES